MNSYSKARYCIQSEKHPYQTSLGLCSLMEHQSLVDIAVCCGSNILHAHKIVLAASSPLFREELERNPGVEQVIISGCEFAVVRSLIEFMYCGETVIAADMMRYLVAAGKLFQMKSLEKLSLDCQFGSGDILILPKPQFLTKKPKYPVYPFAPTNPPRPPHFPPNGLFKPAKPKRRYRFEAEHQACVKEAQASVLAIANLKKEIASAPQANTFIIEETCTETTVENFIPHGDAQGFAQADFAKPNLVQLTLENGLQGLTADKIKTILGGDADANVEVMFKTGDGSFVTVTDEVLRNLQKDGLQYQVIDEEGRMGEVQELRLTAKGASPQKCLSEENVPGPSSTFSYFSSAESVKTLEESDGLEMVAEAKGSIPDGFEVVPNFFPVGVSGEGESSGSGVKFSPDIFFADHVEGAGQVDCSDGNK